MEGIFKLQRFESFLSTLRLDHSLRKLKTVEGDLKGDLNPTDILNQVFMEQDETVNFAEFYELYMKNNTEKLESIYHKQYSDKITWDEFKAGLRARLYRTQCSILTEYQAYYLSKIVFDNVQRSTEMDKRGVDFQILYPGNTYNIHIFTDTHNARFYRDYKSQYKGTDLEKGTHVNLPYSLNPGKIHSVRRLSNNFGVYTHHYLTYLKKEIESGRLYSSSVLGISDSGFIYQEQGGKDGEDTRGAYFSHQEATKLAFGGQEP